MSDYLGSGRLCSPANLASIDHDAGDAGAADDDGAPHDAKPTPPSLPVRQEASAEPRNSVKVLNVLQTLNSTKEAIRKLDRQASRQSLAGMPRSSEATRPSTARSAPATEPNPPTRQHESLTRAAQ